MLALAAGEPCRHGSEWAVTRIDTHGEFYEVATTRQRAGAELLADYYDSVMDPSGKSEGSRAPSGKRWASVFIEQRS